MGIKDWDALNIFLDRCTDAIKTITINDDSLSNLKNEIIRLKALKTFNDISLGDLKEKLGSLNERLLQELKRIQTDFQKYQNPSLLAENKEGKIENIKLKKRFGYKEIGIDAGVIPFNTEDLKWSNLLPMALLLQHPESRAVINCFSNRIPQHLTGRVKTWEQLMELCNKNATVFKVGPSSGLTSGRLAQINCCTLWDNSGKKILFKPENQCIVIPFWPSQCFGQPGDSGSIVFTEDGTVVGMLIGRNLNTEIAVVTPIFGIEQAFGMSFWIPQYHKLAVPPKPPKRLPSPSSSPSQQVKKKGKF
jgi:hypothetical protein